VVTNSVPTIALVTNSLLLRSVHRFVNSGGTEEWHRTYTILREQPFVRSATRFTPRPWPAIRNAITRSNIRDYPSCFLLDHALLWKQGVLVRPNADLPDWADNLIAALAAARG